MLTAGHAALVGEGGGVGGDPWVAGRDAGNDLDGVGAHGALV
jgi:hypothetical protein